MEISQLAFLIICVLFIWGNDGCVRFELKMFFNNGTMLIPYYPIHPPNDSRLTDVNCARVMAGDQEYVKQRVKFRRTRLDPPSDQLDISCEAIRARHPIFARTLPKKDDQNNSIAYARAVYRDYLFLERELATHYVPQNVYCYAIDKKTDDTFRGRMKALAKCIPNVLIAREEYPVEQIGTNMWKSLIECMELLLHYEWNYVINLQNWDTQLKTNEELVQIFKWLNGTNDIQYTHIGSNLIDFSTNNWTLAHLKLFKNESKNLARNPKDGKLMALEKAKGQVQCSLARSFVEWLVNDLNTGPMLDQLNSYKKAALDEVFIPTLAANEFLEAPGGFTRQCFGKHLAPGLTRFAFWVHNSRGLQKCQSKIKRHGVCILGLEDLVPNFKDSPFMVANKMLPGEDADAIHCWHEVMRNRTFSREPGLHRIRAEMYTELPQVRFNELRKRDGKVDLNKFNCHYKFLDEVKDGQEWFT